MSGTRKKKTLPNLQEIFESIKDLLSTTKTQLDASDISLRPSIIENLERISNLAESFTDRRLKAEQDCVNFCDILDQEGAYDEKLSAMHLVTSVSGVTLWNISGLVSKYPDDDGRALAGALRLAAFRLVEAGLEERPGIETLIHVLGLASKTGAILSELGQFDVAGGVLASAAKYEEMMRVEDDPEVGAWKCFAFSYPDSDPQKAWKEGNHTVSEFMAQKLLAIYDEQRLVFPARDRVLLAAKFHDIGKSALKNQVGQIQDKSSDATAWLQKAFGIVDQEESSVPNALELRISILRTLGGHSIQLVSFNEDSQSHNVSARAYFLSECYDSAEATLEELTPSLDASKDHASSEYQELRWLKLAILKKRQSGDTAIHDAFKSIINHMKFTDTTVTDILRELRTLGHQHTLVSAVTQNLLERALQCNEKESESVDRVLLSLIVHCSKDEVHSRAMEVIGKAFTSVCETNTELRSISAAACLSLLWQYGDRHYHGKRWSQAAEWFAAGGHPLFKVHGSSSASKSYRKAALCYIEQREYSRSAAVIRSCPSNEAATHYLAFLIATYQGLEDEGNIALIVSMHAMVNAPDFDRQMLLLATKISHESEMKNVLLAILEALLTTLKISKSGETVIEAMALLRCIIRLILKLLAEPIAARSTLIDSVVTHFRTAKILVNAAFEQKAVSLIIKDVSWLWRTAYNCAVQGCSDWDGFQEQISALFDISKDMLEVYCQASPVEVEPDLYVHLMNAFFSGVAGRAREASSASGSINAKQIREISAEIKSCKARISQIIESNKITGDDELLRSQYFLHTLRVFEAEILAQLSDWDQLLKTIADAVTSGQLAVATYEAIADILWEEKGCPVNVLCGGLEAVLHATLDHNSLSLEKYARWLRAICTITLARNTSADRLKAIGYVEQAVSMMENSDADKAYPMDERFWLLATSYNTGFECLEASSLNEAKRWFEASTVICRFVPGGTERAEKISETYAQLLSRYAPT
ncbi:hypothetical protein GG344DRAFT_75060 [Lentinula edodes]|nr:hypothetical protein GG344DRAFT_75060 [Lentinula edodes]